ncbi:MAG: hypothetical protein NTV33_05030 [Coprothermobacterota bacterium]|nr:hypothetical protein [Coprothermobacterota bacterium]
MILLSCHLSAPPGTAAPQCGILACFAPPGTAAPQCGILFSLIHRPASEQHRYLGYSPSALPAFVPMPIVAENLLPQTDMLPQTNILPQTVPS